LKAPLCLLQLASRCGAGRPCRCWCNEHTRSVLVYVSGSLHLAEQRNGWLCDECRGGCQSEDRQSASALRREVETEMQIKKWLKFYVTQSQAQVWSDQTYKTTTRCLLSFSSDTDNKPGGKHFDTESPVRLTGHWRGIKVIYTTIAIVNSYPIKFLPFY
jgi:hypothetical protein